MTIVYIITAVLAAIILTTVGIHRYKVRHLIERYEEADDELSPLIACPPISIVVVSQNEGRDMEENLPRLLRQRGIDLEVIVVNAASTDTTIDALKRLTIQYPQLRQTYVPTSNANVNVQEAGCMLGARAARNGWVLFVQPSFTPPSDIWVLDLLRYTSPTAKAVIDYGHTNFREEVKESNYKWKRRVKKMTQTVLHGRAIVTAEGSMLIRKDWLLNRAKNTDRGECVYVCRRFDPLQRVILRVRNHRPDFSVLS